MIKRRFYKLEHGDKDSGSDSSCFSSDSDPESEDSEESESEDAVAEVSEDDDSVSEREGEAADDDDSDADDYGGRFEKTFMNRKPDLEEPPEEEEENYILGCMIKCKSVYKCRYCPNTICLNEKTMQAHVSSKKHARSERLLKEEKLRTDGEEVDNPEMTSQEKQIKGNRRSQRKGKRSRKLTTDDKQVDNPETPAQEKQIKGNSRSRRQSRRSQKQEKGSSTTQEEKAEVTKKSRKKVRIETDVFPAM